MFRGVKYPPKDLDLTQHNKGENKMNITLKNEDTLSITLPNGNKVTISNHNNITIIV